MGIPKVLNNVKFSGVKFNLNYTQVSDKFNIGTRQKLIHIMKFNSVDFFSIFFLILFFSCLVHTTLIVKNSMALDHS